jgi:hypothetical protein
VYPSSTRTYVAFGNDIAPGQQFGISLQAGALNSQFTDSCTGARVDGYRVGLLVGATAGFRVGAIGFLVGFLGGIQEVALVLSIPPCFSFVSHGHVTVSQKPPRGLHMFTVLLHEA